MRRIGTSIMLVAACAFTLHTGAVAADFGGAGCLGYAASSDTEIVSDAHVQLAHVHHAHVHPAHMHHAHAHSREAHELGMHGDHPTHQDHGQCKVPCCGTGCTIALLASEISIVPVLGVTATTRLPQASGQLGFEPHGFERPPKSLLLS